MSAEPASFASSPVVILVETQMAENVGAAMRAMANFGLRRLKLVNPREPWPNEKAAAMSSGAFRLLEIETVASLEEAVRDLNLVLATTARAHDIAKPVCSPATAAGLLAASIDRGERVGVVFGRERWGLTTDEVGLADQILTIPVDPAFASLNLAQAVVTVAYEWRKVVVGDAAWTPFPEKERSPLAGKDDVLRMFEHLEGALDAVEFFRPPEKRASMVRNLRSIFQKARLTEQEIRTLRGVIAALEGRSTRPTARPYGKALETGPGKDPAGEGTNS
ncbi:RNA methyltransferase [Prosthecomicrobium sp. N25]|uniref:RNA methyltransferase n=1 Tax=Prosthecomicrobium sp. N25 TaxID=3129254 RepID=UPI0030782FB7